MRLPLNSRVRQTGKLGRGRELWGRRERQGEGERRRPRGRSIWREGCATHQGVSQLCVRVNILTPSFWNILGHVIPVSSIMTDGGTSSHWLTGTRDTFDRTAEKNEAEREYWFSETRQDG